MASAHEKYGMRVWYSGGEATTKKLEGLAKSVGGFINSEDQTGEHTREHMREKDETVTLFNFNSKKDADLFSAHSCRLKAVEMQDPVYPPEITRQSV